MTEKKKTTAAKIKKEKSPIEIQNVAQEQPQVHSASVTPFYLKRNYMILGVVIIGILTILYFTKGYFVASVVNGQPISRFQIISELEKQGGKQTLNALVTRTLILQEAKKQNVVVDDKEVDNEIKKAEAEVAKRGQKLDDVLASQGLTRETVKEQIKFEKMIEKMIAKEVTVTDKDVNDYIEANKESLGAEVNSPELAKNVKEQLRQQKLREKFQAWSQELQTKANILYWANY